MRQQLEGRLEQCHTLLWVSCFVLWELRRKGVCLHVIHPDPPPASTQKQQRRYAVGASVFGWMADTHGRKTALVASCVSTAAVTLVCAAATSYSWYLAGRFLQGVCVSGLPIAAYVLSTESVGPAYRGRAGTASQLIYHFGEWVLPLMALALQDWRLLYAAIAACCLVTALLAMLVPESPRWQLLHGRNTQAGVRTLQWMARLNGRQLPESLAQQLLAESGAGPGGSQGQQGEAAAAAAASAQADANDGSSRSKATAAAGLSGQQQGEEDCHSGGGQQQQDQDQDDDCVALLAIAADQARQPKEVGQQQQQHAEVLSEDVQERRQEDLSSSSSGGVGAGAGSHAPHKPDSVWLVFSDPLLARLFWVSMRQSGQNEGFRSWAGGMADNRLQLLLCGT